MRNDHISIDSAPSLTPDEIAECEREMLHFMVAWAVAVFRNCVTPQEVRDRIAAGYEILEHAEQNTEQPHGQRSTH